MIAELIDKTGEARLTDLARGLGVTHVTANRTHQAPAAPGARHDAAVSIDFPHRQTGGVSPRSRATGTRLVVRFLTALGVPAAVAESDAEGIEHHVSRETLAAFVRHIRRRG